MPFGFRIPPAPTFLDLWKAGYCERLLSWLARCIDRILPVKLNRSLSTRILSALLTLIAYFLVLLWLTGTYWFVSFKYISVISSWLSFTEKSFESKPSGIRARFDESRGYARSMLNWTCEGSTMAASRSCASWKKREWRLFRLLLCCGKSSSPYSGGYNVYLFFFYNDF